MFHSLCIIQQSATIRSQYIAKLVREYRVHPIDVKILADPAVTIAQVRALQFFLSRKPFASSLKIVVISADALTAEAQQALLKTLEEPPPASLVILSLTNPDFLLPTVLSRCRLIFLADAPTTSAGNTLDTRKFWQNLLTYGAGKRLEAASALTKDRALSRAWTKDQLLFWRNELLNFYQGTSEFHLTSPALVSILRKLVTASVQIEQNLSLKLIIDQLFLQLPKTS